MNGYLQRLVKNANSPLTNVRPLRGSIFARGQHELNSQSLEVEEKLATADDSLDQNVPPLFASQFTLEGFQPQIKRESDAVPSETREQSAQGSQPNDGVPLGSNLGLTIGSLSEARKLDNIEPFDSAPAISETDAGDRLSGVDGFRLRPRRRIPEHVEASEPSTVFKSLLGPVSGKRSVTPSKTISEDLDVRTVFANAAKPDGQPNGRPTSQQREADEIHINIGRIEVTAAVPSPPARTTPPPLRKGPDLSEFLKQRDGRRR